MNHHGSRNRRDGITSRFRLRGYDYSTPGMYFITICTERRIHRFGEVVDDQMALSPSGVMVTDLWADLSATFTDVAIDVSVTMPNHVHAIIGIGLTNPDLPHASLSEVVHWYKSTTSTHYIHGVRADGWPRFDGKLWQPGFHDHVIRNERSLERLREYIEANPARWDQDTFARKNL